MARPSSCILCCILCVVSARRRNGRGTADWVNSRAAADRAYGSRYVIRIGPPAASNSVLVNAAILEDIETTCSLLALLHKSSHYLFACHGDPRAPAPNQTYFL